MECPTCGYLYGPLDTECVRCKAGYVPPPKPAIQPPPSPEIPTAPTVPYTPVTTPHVGRIIGMWICWLVAPILFLCSLMTGIAGYTQIHIAQVHPELAQGGISTGLDVAASVICGILWLGAGIFSLWSAIFLVRQVASADKVNGWIAIGLSIFFTIITAGYLLLVGVSIFSQMQTP